MNTINVFPDTNLVIRAERVFDGRTLLPGKKKDIIISSGKISQIVQGNGPAPAGGIKFIDLQGYTVLPGLVDCHVHLALDGRDFNGAMDLWSRDSLLLERVGSDLRNTLNRGIVAVRDGGDREWVGLRVRDEVNQGKLAGPRILSPGIALGKKGKYGPFLGPGITGDQIEETVKKTAARGVDHIKVLVSGVVSFKEYRRVGEIQFSRGELAELVSASHQLGLKVMAHASSDEASRMAAEAGVNSLEHGYFISRSTLEVMADRGIPWIPTLIPVAIQARGWLRKGHTPEKLEVIEKTYRQQLKMVKKASELGVLLGTGTDAGATGVLHGDGLLEEMQLLEEAGLGRDEILRSATVNGALALGLEKELGMVRPGLPPYLIAVRGDPLKDLSCLRNIEFMILPSGGNCKI